MITFDRIRSALLDADPHVAMDRLVQSELAVGRKTRAIYDELLGHIEAVRAMAEYTDELEDPLGDTLDALCGLVHPSCAYTDPPAPAEGPAVNGSPATVGEQVVVDPPPAGTSGH
jgi:hypothetical protein